MSETREPRLGDLVDDYCSRCRLVMNHGVVGLVGSTIKRTRCNTCLHEHAFRKAKIPAQKKDKVKDLFDQVLSGMPPAKPEKKPEEAPKRRRTAHLGMRPLITMPEKTRREAEEREALRRESETGRGQKDGARGEGRKDGRRSRGRGRAGRGGRRAGRSGGEGAAQDGDQAARGSEGSSRNRRRPRRRRKRRPESS